MPGPFYFAWADPTETTFGPEHLREDEFIFALTISQVEGDLAGLTIDVLNPRIGLLNEGRKQWAWLAWDAGDSAGPQPLFFGRMIGVPADSIAEVVQLEFIARPADYDAQRRALAETLKVAPYWDPIWLNPDEIDDPTAVLAARPALWHTDRVTHIVTISDINSGEDGVLDLGGDIFYEEQSIQYRQVPGRRVRMMASVAWNQAATGQVDMTQALLKAAKAAGSGNGQNIDTYTGEGLARTWPEQGRNIGGDWSVGESYVIRGNGKWVPLENETILLQTGTTASFPSWSFRPVFKTIYDASRSRIEHVSFELESDVQALVTDPGDEDVILLTYSSQQLNEPIDPPYNSDGIGNAPIQDARRACYFKTDRGLQSLEYLIAVARAQLLGRARAVEVSFKTRWENGLDLSCRKNVRIADPRLPGGEATGKVIGYALSASGDSGVMECAITIGCTIGQGNTVSASAGTPDYVEDGYVEDGYQTRIGGVIMPIAGEVTYDDFSAQPIADDGVDFFNMNPSDVLQPTSDSDGILIIDGKPVQKAVLKAFHADLSAAINALNQVFTEIRVDLKPLNTGPFETSFDITLSNLMIPKTIDLEAPAGSA